MCRLPGGGGGVGGNTADPNTVPDKSAKNFANDSARLVLVGDRGMITSARIREDSPDDSGIQWITALRATPIQKLAV